MDGVRWTDVVFGVAAAVSALAVVLAVLQLRLAKAIIELEFEDGSDNEYRDLISCIPTKALPGSGLPPCEYKATFNELYRYFDLSNQQIIPRTRKPVSPRVWTQWCAEIQYNLKSLPTFKRAWNDIKTRRTSFEELRKLEKNKFKDDPAEWGRG